MCQVAEKKHKYCKRDHSLDSEKRSENKNRDGFIRNLLWPRMRLNLCFFAQLRISSRIVCDIVFKWMRFSLCKSTCTNSWCEREKETVFFLSRNPPLNVFRIFPFTVQLVVFIPSSIGFVCISIFVEFTSTIYSSFAFGYKSFLVEFRLQSLLRVTEHGVSNYYHSIFVLCILTEWKFISSF